MVERVYPPDRAAIAAFVGNDPKTIKAIETLFRLAGVQTPETVEAVSVAIGNALAAAADANEGVTLARQEAAINDLTEQVAAIANRLDGVTEIAAPDVWQPPVTGAGPLRYGMFHDTTTQTAAAINTAYAVRFNTTVIASGVSIVSNSRVTVWTAGTYNFQITLQSDKGSGSGAHLYAWMRRNGTVDIPGTAVSIYLHGSGAEVFSGFNFFVELAAGEYVEFMWATDHLDVTIRAFAAAPPVPAVSSAVLSVNNVEGPK